MVWSASCCTTTPALLQYRHPSTPPPSGCGGMSGLCHFLSKVEPSLLKTPTHLRGYLFPPLPTQGRTPKKTHRACDALGGGACLCPAPPGPRYLPAEPSDGEGPDRRVYDALFHALGGSMGEDGRSPPRHGPTSCDATHLEYHRLPQPAPHM
mmetsp:Transcript_104698/g.180549  ORF Transcript_104698/g.180549 Transcript_104698/m.180549 type:complete len:152 (-) Transcript_104698:113-568(-)